MSRRFAFTAALLASAVLVSGCANNSQPINHGQQSHAAAVDRALAPVPVVTQPVAVPIPQALQAPIAPLKTSTSSGVTNTISAPSSALQARIDEIMAESARLGSLGDYQGEIDVLIQAGYYGHPQAFYEVARKYLNGPIEKDERLATQYITLAHEGGYDEATRVLGMLYLRGQGVPEDMNYGRLLLDKASQTSARAAREYALLLMNKASPQLNDWELGISKLREASLRGDYDASVLLATELEKAGRTQESEDAKQAVQMIAATQASPASSSASPLESNDTDKSRAVRGDLDSMFLHAQKLLVRKTPSNNPELDAYCWLSVASSLGHHGATTELALLGGIKANLEKNQPGRLDQCISDLHSRVTNR